MVVKSPPAAHGHDDQQERGDPVRHDRLVDCGDVCSLHQRGNLIVSAVVFHGTAYESVADIGDAHQIRLAEEHNVDLIAMSTHGHRFFNDLLRGTTVSKVRHVVKIPVLRCAQ